MKPKTNALHHRRQHAGLIPLLLAALFSATLLPQATAATSEEIARRAKESTVRVFILDASNQPIGTGTGFFITTQGHVATNHHVALAENAASLAIAFGAGHRVYVRVAEVIGFDQNCDLAILKAELPPGAKPLPLATAPVVAGQEVLAVDFPGVIDFDIQDQLIQDGPPGNLRVGNPGDASFFDPAVYGGEVAKLDTSFGIDCIFHSAKISPGNSGGPLIDAEGRACGINTLFIPATSAGTDYPVSVHANALTALAQRLGVPVNIVAARALSRDAIPREQFLFLIILTLVVGVIVVIIALRKPTVIMTPLSRLVGRGEAVIPQRQTPPPLSQPLAQPRPHTAPPTPPARTSGTMRLRGRDLNGQSFNIAFGIEDFQRNRGRLVIGRNNRLSCSLPTSLTNTSQLTLSSLIIRTSRFLRFCPQL